MKHEYPLDKIKERLCDMGYEDTVLFENPNFDTAIIGVTTDGRAVYDYQKMVEYLVMTDKISVDDAMDFIEYNTIRSLPYITNAPIVFHNLNFLED